jgi:hypothetical protein
MDAIVFGPGLKEKALWDDVGFLQTLDEVAKESS